MGKLRNTNRILGELAPYLSSFRDGYQTIYFLNKAGREYVQSEKVRRKTQFVNHAIMRNQLYLHVGCPVDWNPEMRIKEGKVSLVADAIFKAGGKTHFLEVDSIQKMAENKVKIQSYRELYQRKVIEKGLGYFPVVIFVTASDYRKKQLQGLLEGVPSKVFTIQEIN